MVTVLFTIVINGFLEGGFEDPGNLTVQNSGSIHSRLFISTL